MVSDFFDCVETNTAIFFFYKDAAALCLLFLSGRYLNVIGTGVAQAVQRQDYDLDDSDF